MQLPGLIFYIIKKFNVILADLILFSWDIFPWCFKITFISTQCNIWITFQHFLCNCQLSSVQTKINKQSEQRYILHKPNHRYFFFGDEKWRCQAVRQLNLRKQSFKLWQQKSIKFRYRESWIMFSKHLKNRSLEKFHNSFCLAFFLSDDIRSTQQIQVPGMHNISTSSSVPEKTFTDVQPTNYLTHDTSVAQFDAHSGAHFTHLHNIATRKRSATLQRMRKNIYSQMFRTEQGQYILDRNVQHLFETDPVDPGGVILPHWTHNHNNMLL